MSNRWLEPASELCCFCRLRWCNGRGRHNPPASCIRNSPASSAKIVCDCCRLPGCKAASTHTCKLSSFRGCRKVSENGRLKTKTTQVEWEADAHPCDVQSRGATQQRHTHTHTWATTIAGSRFLFHSLDIVFCANSIISERLCKPNSCRRASLGYGNCCCERAILKLCINAHTSSCYAS